MYYYCKLLYASYALSPIQGEITTIRTLLRIKAHDDLQYLL